MFGDFEEDPAAEFLERERKELEGIEGGDASAEFFGSSPLHNGLSNGNFDPLQEPSNAGIEERLRIMFGDFEEDPAAEFLERERKELEGIEGGDASAEFFGSSPLHNGLSNGNFDPLQEPSNGPSFVNDFEFVESKNNAYATLEPQAFAEPVPVNDCEKVRQWKQDFIKRIEDKDAQEQESNEAMKEEAAAALEEWMKRTAEQRSNIRSNNREDEKIFVQERDSSTPGGEWEKVCRLCDFSGKAATSRSVVSGGKDVSRMRSVLLQLKQTPPVHFAAN